MRLRVFIAVTHLLGVGHLARAAAIGRALVRAGHQVLLATGGRPALLVSTEGMMLLQLPPLHCVGTDFRTLLDDDGRPVGPEALERRRMLLVAGFRGFAPHVLVTELFPFGRRQLGAEFDALLEAAQSLKSRPAVLCSIRDVLNPPSKPSRAAEALERLGRFYDGVLVHGDPAIVPLSASWPVDASLERRLTYTGYIAEDTAGDAPRDARGDEIVVSGGGSAASLPLFEAALGAARLMPERPWRILVGHAVAEPAFRTLEADAPANAVVERARPDFPDLLRGAAVSVSLAGYNTVVDVLQAGVRAVFVPFDAGGEREQTLRARRFEDLGLAAVVPQQDVSAERLAEAVARQLASVEPVAAAVDLGGAAASVRAIERAAARAADRTAAWARLSAALDALADQRRTLTVWWRDDDAVTTGPALDRLLALARRFRAPIGLAVIPARAEPGLAERVAADDATVDVLVHGFAHGNHAPPGAKKRELGDRPANQVLDEIAAGLAGLRRLFGDRALPVLVPPWNRIDPALVPLLGATGIRGLSVFKPRAAPEAAPGVALVNTHCDPVDWRSGGGLADEVNLIAGLASHIEAMIAGTAADEPVGLLTHHLVHDEWTWSFVDRLLAVLARHRAVRFGTARLVFGLETATGHAGDTAIRRAPH
jgi:predicted glycosyltransferase